MGCSIGFPPDQVIEEKGGEGETERGEKERERERGGWGERELGAIISYNLNSEVIYHPFCHI